MHKDDIEFFSMLNKHIPCPMIVAERPKKIGLMNLLNMQTRNELIWSSFYPSNQDRILVGFTIERLTYYIEITPDQCNEQVDSFFLNKIRKEIKEIMSGKEEFYFSEIIREEDEKKEVNKLTSIILDKHKLSKPKVSYFSVKDKNYVMVGLNGPHLARTTIYISNKK